MKKIIVMVCLIVPFIASAQLTAKRIKAANGQYIGFYQHTPSGWSTSTAKYPVIIFLHGVGERGNGTTELYRVKNVANRNIELLADLVSEEHPIVGIEPSAILTFRDEYPDLATDENLEASMRLAKNSFLVDEFIASEITKSPPGVTPFFPFHLLSGACNLYLLLQ